MSGPRMGLADFKVVISPTLPTYPSPGEDARRIVRHGMADILEWLGEKVGPKPGAPTHVIRTAMTLIVSEEAAERLRDLA